MIHCNSLGSPYEGKSVFSTKKYVVPFNAGKPTPVTYSKFRSKVVVVLLFFYPLSIVAYIMGFCFCSMFYYAVLCVFSYFFALIFI